MNIFAEVAHFLFIGRGSALRSLSHFLTYIDKDCNSTWLLRRNCHSCNSVCAVSPLPYQRCQIRGHDTRKSWRNSNGCRVKKHNINLQFNKWNYEIGGNILRSRVVKFIRSNLIHLICNIQIRIWASHSSYAMCVCMCHMNMASHRLVVILCCCWCCLCSCHTTTILIQFTSHIYKISFSSAVLHDSFGVVQCCYLVALLLLMM